MLKRRGHGWQAPVAWAMVMALSACSRATDPAQVTAAQAHELAANLASTRAIVLQLEQDEVRLALDCLVDHGYPEVPPPPRLDSEGPEVILDLLGFVTAEVEANARETPDYWGAITRAVDDQPPAFKNQLFGGSDDAWDEFKIAGNVLGTNTDGCIAASRARLYGGLEEFLLVTYLPQIALNEVDVPDTGSAADREAPALAWVQKHAGLIADAYRLAHNACEREKAFGCKIPQT